MRTLLSADGSCLLEVDLCWVDVVVASVVGLKMLRSWWLGTKRSSVSISWGYLGESVNRSSGDGGEFREIVNVKVKLLWKKH